MKIFKPAATYFAFVFGAGFVLGTIRTLLLVPQFGDRISELLEMPLMLMAIVLSAQWLNQHFPQTTQSEKLGTGFLALVFLLLAEIGVGVALRGMSPLEALLNRDPVSGTLYYVMLGVFALMPWLLSARKNKN